MVATASTKISVSPASRMLSAISFGVFCRDAPSTRAIMRSRNVEPWAAVMRTRMRSLITCVPPVTAERSPPASRITGALSPVMAASLTEATPSMISPSDGISSPASTTTMSPCFRLVPSTSSVRPPEVSRRAMASVLARRRLAACALPRPSATASAKLANSTVNHSQMLICNSKPRLPFPARASRISRMVVSVVTISTTNITGLRHSVRGSSFANAWRMAGNRMRGSAMVVAVRRRAVAGITTGLST